MRKRLFLAVLWVAGGMWAAAPPEARISNRQIEAVVYLPDPVNGFYRGTRFDWSGVISSLRFAGHSYYGPWFTKFDPAVRDFAYQGSDIVVGAPSASMGPADEFQTPQGYESATAGGTFVKIGVGVLRKPDDAPYNAFRPYEIVDSGQWAVQKTADSISFIQELKDPAGYGYVYRKTLRLVGDKPEMTMEHSLRNTGRLTLQGNSYNHNFLVLDQVPTGPGVTVKVPWEIKPVAGPDPRFGEIQGTQLAYTKTLEQQERLTSGLQGFGAGASDYDIRVENRRAGAGLRMQGDRPLQTISLWSIRSVMAVEPFVAFAAEPGHEFTWKYTYTFYTVSR